MGGSPVKQTDDGLVSKGKLESDVFRNNEAKIELLKLENQERERKAKETKGKSEKPTIDKLRDRSKKEEQDASGEILSESSSAPDGDNDVNQYKSKEQIKQDNKTRKTEAKYGTGKDDTEERTILGLGKGKLGTKKYTKAEKQANKDSRLQDKLQRQKGTGENAYSFSLKNALLGDSFASGLTYGAKHKKTQKKIDKRAQKAANTETKISGKAKRKAIRDAAKKKK